MLDYPEYAIREALINAFVHREYSLSSSIMIQIADNQIRILSPGSLPTGIAEDDIGTGLSLPRNRNLAQIFYRLRLIESYGTGIERIYASYSDAGVKPDIRVTTNTFTIFLPNRNTAPSSGLTEVHSSKGDTHEAAIATPPASDASVSSDKQKILEWVDRNGSVNAAQISGILHCGRTRAFRILREMREGGLLMPAVGHRGEYRRSE